MEIRSLPLEKLNLLAEKRRFLLEDMDFIDTDHRSLPWAPIKITAFSGLPAFQLWAIGVLEQFIWFEGPLISRILHQVVKKTENKELRKALVYFVEDEEKHTEMFWRLLQAVEPNFYPQREFKFLKLGKMTNKLVDWVVATPTLNLAWIWLAIFFEERTMNFSQEYLKAKAEVHPWFVKAHELHLQDEARHFQMDIYFLENFYDPQPRWKKLWAAFLFKRVMRAYTSPRKVSLQVLHQLQLEFSDLSLATVQALKADLKQIRFNKTFLKNGFGPDVVPRCRELLSRYPETKSVLEMFG